MRKRNPALSWLIAAPAIAMLAPAATAQSIIVQSTTSTKNAGFYDYVLPRIKADTGVTVHVVAVGTGQAIKNAQNCDGDVLLVHSRPAEEKFVAAGFGVKRTDLMYNDFIVVGPASDPVKLAGSSDAISALKKIAAGNALFASRGDASGTHKMEMSLWKMAGIDPKSASGKWYRETGSGMGATLNAGVGMGAYVLTDRATWIKFQNKGDFTIAAQGNKRLLNQYGVILVNTAKCPQVKADLGQKVIDWLLSAKGQKVIDSYKVAGQQLFFANAPQ